jgi:heptosyltransferase I
MVADVRTATADRIHQLLKRTQQRILAADYDELRLRSRRLEPDPDGGYSVRTLPVVPDAAAIETLLVFKPDEIGDAVYALPAVAELRRCLPHARIFLVCRGLTAPLYLRSGVVDELAVYEPRSRVGPFRRRLARSLQTFSTREFDAGIFLRTYPATFREFMSVPCRARVHPLDPRLRSSSPYRPHVGVWDERRVHQALQMLQIVAPLTGRDYTLDDSVFPSLEFSDEERSRVADALGSTLEQPFVVLHPFAKDETRRYPVEYWRDVIVGLERGFDVPLVVIGGPEDPSLPETPSLVQLQGRLGLLETAYLLSRAAGFVGNLSGPAHLAAAVGTPTFTLMSGHSLPAEWAPRGDARLVRADVPCAPCHQRTCPIYGLACLRELTPQRVLPEILSFLEPRLVGGRQAPAYEPEPSL